MPIQEQDLIKKINALDCITQYERAYLISLLNTQKKYGLAWEGKSEGMEDQLRETLPVIREVKDKTVLNNNSFPNHFLIEGDNLHALTALTFTHEGKVDVIYIDPPYNTGNKDFKYNDSYVDKEDSFRHSKWLSFMNRRLQIAKRLLSRNGAIFISIDDNEQAQLKLLCDEIFGEENFTGQLIWEKGKKGDAKFFSVTHEYILVYAKSKSFLLSSNVKWRRRKEGVDDVLLKYAQIREEFFPDHSAIRKGMMNWYKSLPKDDVRRKHKHYNYSDDRGLYFADNFAGPDDGRLNRPRYDILHPVTNKPCAKPSTGWRWDEETTKKALVEVPSRIHFGKDETTIPCRKSYLFEIDTEPFQSVFYKDGRVATLQLEELVGKGKFNFPKDVDVLCQLIALNSGDRSIILDFFAGSGSTLHATMQLNAEDGYNRQCILVTNNENNIAEEVCYERNRKVIQGYTNVKGEHITGLQHNNLRYYQCEFVSREPSIKTKRELTKLATELLCIKEDIYTETNMLAGQKLSTSSVRCFHHDSQYLLVIYSEDVIEQMVETIKETVQQKEDRNIQFKVYVFSNGQYPYTEEFEEVLPYVTLCSLPEAIYKAYMNVLPSRRKKSSQEVEMVQDETGLLTL